MEAMDEAGHPCLDQTLLADDALGMCSGTVWIQGALTEQEAADFAEEYTTGEAFGVGVGTVVIGRTSSGVFWGIAAGTTSTAEQYADALGGTIY